MGFYAAKQLVKKLIGAGKNILGSKVVVMGATFKENVADSRNSKVADLVCELKSYGVKVDVVDPYASSEVIKHEYGFDLVENPANDYDAVVVAVNHRPYMKLTENDLKNYMQGTENPILVDIKGIFRNKIKDLTYWSF
jgi:UDP-N-acetyl-D-galactosamine dehydrogenase